MRFRVGVDIGGTFTDLVMLTPDGRLFSKKVLSTVDDYSRAIEEGVAALLVDAGAAAADVAEFAHATTIATNAIIERRGAAVALLTTKGFRDVLEMGRFRSPRLYDLRFRKPDPLVERRLRFEVTERVNAKGEVLQPLDYSDLDRVAAALKRERVVALAICFLNSHANAEHENSARRYLEEKLPELSISSSTQLLPQINEYERTSTTVVNAYIRPTVEKYVASLSVRLNNLGVTAPLMIMQSSGGILPGPLVRKNPVYIIESGPAAGVVGAQRLGKHIGLADMIVFDMGGTTAKASLIEGHTFGLSSETEVGGGAALGHRLIQGGGYVVQVPTIEIAEVGAGGGSIASIDVAGGIRVGPRSAGADPGPVCYDRGGTQPTVTDANLYLGYLNREALVGGGLRVNFRKAEAAIEDLGKRCEISAVDAAYGIHLIANGNMMRALNGVSSERGRDPAHFDLMAIGGNGPVHAGSLAESLRIKRILVPTVAGLFSALGLLFADVEHQLVTAFYHRLSEAKPDELNRVVTPVYKEVEELLASEGFDRPEKRSVTVYADVRYVGQTMSLTLPLQPYPSSHQTFRTLAADYGDAHDRTYGYRSDAEPIQIVALKVIGRGISDVPRVPVSIALARTPPLVRQDRKAYFGPANGWLTVPVLPRASLSRSPQDGPLIIEEYDTTTVVLPGWRAHRDEWNNIVMEKKES